MGHQGPLDGLLSGQFQLVTKVRRQEHNLSSRLGVPITPSSHLLMDWGFGVGFEQWEICAETADSAWLLCKHFRSVKDPFEIRLVSRVMLS